MARIKVTSSDINAKLARGECANFRNNGCQGRTPCLVVNGEPCQYFATYVKPLLDYPDYLNKYGREAKITVALNPKAKVVRKRRLAAEPTLGIKSSPPAAAPAPAQSQPALKPAKPEPAVSAATPRPLPAPIAQPAKPTPARAVKETPLLLPVTAPVTKGKKASPPVPAATPAPLPPKTATTPALAVPTPPRNAQSPTAPTLTLTVASTPPVKRAKTAPASATTPLPATPPTPPPPVTTKPQPAPEQPQLFDDLFAVPPTPSTSKKRLAITQEVGSKHASSTRTTQAAFPQ